MSQKQSTVRHKVYRMSGRSDVLEIISMLKEARLKGNERIELDVADIGSIYPNGAIPVAAAVHLLRDEGIDVRFVNIQAGSFFERTMIRSPLIASTENLNEPLSRLNTIWAYTEVTAVGLADCVIEELAERIEFGDGSLEALNWCLYEVLDNVFQHARCEVGFFMAQILKHNNRLLLCVADSGIGVHRSFYLGGVYRPPSAFDALTLAVREGVSSTGDKRGNGLYGLKGVVEAIGGRLELGSGRGWLRVTASGVEGYNVSGAGLVIDKEHHCTVVDFELDVSQPVSLSDVLGADQINLRLEAIETDSGYHVVRLIDHAQGTGTRAAAERLRNFLINYLSEGAPYLVLDFTGVVMVSSSFADETIGKLAERFGPLGFSQRFRLVNMNASVHALLDRAIALRVANNYYRDDRTP